MSYKVDIDKAIRIIRSVNPAVIFVNALPYTNQDSLSDTFKENGYSVYHMKESTKDEIQKARNYLQRAKGSYANNTICIIGDIADTDDIIGIFDGIHPVFTYIYMYPNNQIKYLERLNQNSPASADSANQKRIKELSDINRSRYQEHLEIFEDRIFTVLV